MTYPQQIQVINQLPVSLTDKLMDHIKKVRLLDEKYTKITVEGKSVDIDIDAVFFSKD